MSVAASVTYRVGPSFFPKLHSNLKIPGLQYHNYLPNNSQLGSFAGQIEITSRKYFLTLKSRRVYYGKTSWEEYKLKSVVRGYHVH